MDVVNGAAGLLRERIGFGARDAIRDIAQAVGQPLRPFRVEQHDVVDARRGDLAGGGVEIATFGDALGVELDERRAERRVVGDEGSFEIGPLPGAETHAGALALDDHADGDTLHPARRRGLAPAEDAPQDRRGLPTHDAVELAPPLLGFHELHVEVARVGERFADGVGRDLVKNHAPDGDARIERFQDVPADGLALAILVGGEDELVGALERGLQLGDDLLLVGRHDVAGVEVVVGVDAGQAAVRLLLVVGDLFLAARKVADVPDTCFHRVIAPEVARDGLGLRGGLDDHERFRHCFSI